MKSLSQILVCLGLFLHSSFVVSTKSNSSPKSVKLADPPSFEGMSSFDNLVPGLDSDRDFHSSNDAVDLDESESAIPTLAPEIRHFLHLEKVDPRTHKKLFMDTTEYGQPLNLRRGQLSLDVDPLPVTELDSAAFPTSDLPSFDSVITSLGVPPAVDMFVTAIETLPTHPAVAAVDEWAQEARAGFMGYFESLAKLWDKESGSVENKLFEAADAYSHRFFNLVHVQESEHPVLAAKMSRIILALVLSLSLVFVIFWLALHLQRTLVARAHEQAAKQQPGEAIFFAMPYPHLREDNIVIVNNP